MGDTKRATIYLDERLHKALRLKAAESDLTISDLVNRAVGQSLAEDAIDIEAIEGRKNQSERSFTAFVRGLRKDGLI